MEEISPNHDRCNHDYWERIAEKYIGEKIKLLKIII